jgi:hypothetical protein
MRLPIEEFHARQAARMSPKAQRLLKKVQQLLEREGYDTDDRDDFRLYDGYSGRGMYGEESPLAFVTSVRPNESLGRKFQQWGFTYDNMGMSYIYYIHGDL